MLKISMYVLLSLLNPGGEGDRKLMACLTDHLSGGRYLVWFQEYIFSSSDTPRGAGDIDEFLPVYIPLSLHSHRIDTHNFQHLSLRGFLHISEILV